jgi:hypothetical protein
MKALDLHTLNGLLATLDRLQTQVDHSQYHGQKHAICQDGHGSKQMIVLGFGCINFFQKSLEVTFQPTNAPIQLSRGSGMHLVVCHECSMIHIWWPPHIAKSPHNEHILTNVTGITKQVFKVSIIMSEVCMATSIKFKIVEDCNIMKRTRKSRVQVNEETFV